MSVATARRLLGLALLGALLPAGCGGKSYSLAEVDGTVTLKGAPLANVVVEFVPDEAGGTFGPRSSAVTDAAGHFVLQCTDGRPGAVVGRHGVTVVQAGRGDPGGGSESRDPRRKAKSGGAPSPGDAAPTLDPQVLAAYRSPGQTPLHQQVQPGKQTIDIPLP
jgi:hypothetical protein